MAQSNWNIVSFSDDLPQWRVFDGEKLVPQERTDKKEGPVILLLPDDYFFFTMLSAPRTLREHRIHEGLRMRMRHSFPPAVQDQEIGSFRINPEQVLGFASHPALKKFIQRHQALIDTADVVTTGFVICAAAAGSKGLQAWAWENGQGPEALVKDGDLHYFRSSQDELEKRKSVLDAEQEAKSLTLEESLSALHDEAVRPARLRVPLKSLQSTLELEPRFWTRVFAAVVVAGLLFCAGEYLRLRSIQKDVLAYETKIENLYESVLGEDPGKDPLGTLLYRLEQRRGGGQSGIDVMGLLAVLSEEAPPGFTVESLSYNGDSGGIRALTDSFDKLDAMLERLRANDEYEFTLEQATNTEDGVLMSLNFTLK